MCVYDFISLFGGLALFLYGMRIMGEGLTRSSSTTLKNVMEKVSNNPLTGFLLGLVVTSVIQSSTATIVLTSGLVAAGILTLHQSLGIILGANVGTTVTGQIIRLLDLNAADASWLNLFKPSTLAPVAAIVGIVFVMLIRSRRSENIGRIAMGFGILFTGLLNMTAAVSPLSESPSFARLFMTLADKPVLGFLAGTAAAFTTQSSSATVGILQALSTTGKLSFSSVYAVIVGIYLGDCVTTAIVCSLGAKADARRTGMVHILFNICQITLILLAVTVLHRVGLLNGIWGAPVTSGSIANTNTLFKLGCAVLLLPACGLFERLSCRIIPDDPIRGRRIDAELKCLDETLFDSPALALASAHKVVSAVADQAYENIAAAIGAITACDPDEIEKLSERERDIDTLTDRVCNYLVHMAPHVQDGGGSEKLNYYLKCVSEFERIGDFATNLTENARELQEKCAYFTPTAERELALLQEALDEILGSTHKAFVDEAGEAAYHIEPIEEVIDDLVSVLRANHLLRLRSGACNVTAGIVFLDILVNIERIADQCSNIGIHTISLSDSRVARMQHDYIRHLHQGEDERFNREYATARKKYFARLGEIERALQPTRAAGE